MCDTQPLIDATNTPTDAATDTIVKVKVTDTPAAEVTAAKTASTDALTALLGDQLLGSGKKPLATADAFGNSEVIGLYFSAHWCPPCRGFTPKLAKTYDEMKADGKPFEIVFVSSDQDEEQFKSYFDEMPWLALPYSARDLKAKLSKKYKVSGIPSLVLLNNKGEVITTNGRTKVADPAAFPWTPKPFSELLGDTFVRPDGTEVGKDQIAGKTLGLYFSAHWCPPCRGFTPKLKDTYNKLVEDGKEFEIIFCSSDRDESSFQEYHGEMPWLALPYSDRKRKEALGELFDVSGIPALIMVDSNGKVINDSARGRVGSDPEGKEFPWAPKPVNELSEGADGINDSPSLVVLAEEQNAAVKTEVEEAITAIAEAEIAEKDGNDGEMLFFTAKSNSGVVPQIRKLCELGEASAGACQMVILDIPDEGGYYVCEDSGKITAGNIRSFLDGYKNKTLTRKQLN